MSFLKNLFSGDFGGHFFIFELWLTHMQYVYIVTQNFNLMCDPTIKKRSLATLVAIFHFWVLFKQNPKENDVLPMI